MPAVAHDGEAVRRVEEERTAPAPIAHEQIRESTSSSMLSSGVSALTSSTLGGDDLDLSELSRFFDSAPSGAAPHELTSKLLRLSQAKRESTALTKQQKPHKPNTTTDSGEKTATDRKQASVAAQQKGKPPTANVEPRAAQTRVPADGKPDRPATSRKNNSAAAGAKAANRSDRKKTRADVSSVKSRGAGSGESGSQRSSSASSSSASGQSGFPSQNLSASMQNAFLHAYWSSVQAENN